MLEEKVDEVEVEEERILAGGRKPGGSMVGRRRVLCTCAVGEAWERFSLNHAHVVERAFTAVGFSLPTYKSRDSEISIKDPETSLFAGGLKGWAQGAVGGTGVVEEDYEGEGDNEEKVELDITQDELDGEYIVGDID